MLLEFILFVLGFVFLIRGADFLIIGSSSLANYFGVSKFVIGASVVALGTSLPELVVNIFSSLNNNSDLIVGNIAGSNIVNALLLLGVGVWFVPLFFSRGAFRIDLSVYVLVILFLFLSIFVNFLFFDFIGLFWFNGLFFLFGFCVYLFFLFKPNSVFERDLSVSKRVFVLVFLGGLGIFFGGDLVVRNAILMSSWLGMSNMFFGSLFIALGTSLPELITMFVSFLNKEHDLAIGNIIGSNIFNILLVLGVSSLVSSVGFSALGVLNFLFVFFTACLLLFLLFFSKRFISKNFYKFFLFFVFISLYVVYLLFLFFS